LKLSVVSEDGFLAKSFNPMPNNEECLLQKMKELTQALTASEQGLTQFLEALPVGVAVIDSTGKVSYTNQMGKNLLGKDILLDTTSENRAANYQFYRAGTDQLYPRERLPLVRALKGETVTVDDIEIHRDGKVISLEMRTIPILDTQGNIDYAITVFHDISERKRLETERQQASKALWESEQQTLERQVAERTAQLSLTNLRLEQEIASRQQIELALKNSEEKLSTILDSAGAYIYIKDLQGNYTYVNPLTVELFGIPKQEIIGANDFKFFSEEMAQSLRQNDREVIESGTVLRAHEAGVVKNSGELRHYFAVKVPLKQADGSICGVCGIATDITELKQAEEALRQNEARYLAILEDQTELIARFLPDGTLTFVNVAYCRFFGLTREELLWKTYEPIVFEEDREYVAQLLSSISKENPVVTIENRVIVRGQVRWTQWVNRAIFDDASRIVEFQAVGRDISERKKADAEFERAKKAAEAANRAKSTFLANMSHELRTPLNAILGFSQLMNQDANLSTEQKENLNIIHRSGEHLLTLINQVLDLSKVEAGRMTLSETNFDLHRLLADVEDMFSLTAKDKGLQLRFNCAANVPKYIRTDEVKLRQVLINLVSNAVKFTDSGSVSFEVKSRRGGFNDGFPTTLSATRTAKPARTKGKTEAETQTTNNIDAQAASRRVQQTTITFEVKDTGVGIAADELEKLFNPFVQATSSQRVQQGTGLGLTISRQFVRLMGGEITVISRGKAFTPGMPLREFYDDTTALATSGTLFKFDIPVGIADGSEIHEAPHNCHVVALAPNQPNYRLLVVDDSDYNRQLLVKLLKPFGFEVRQATNGQEAVEIWDSYSPHLIWMDMRMPVMDGYEATKCIKSTTKGQATAVIALTASVWEEEKAVILSAGCDDFVRKPFQEQIIFDTMAKHLGVRYIYQEKEPPSHPSNATVEPLNLTDLLAAMPKKWSVKLYKAALDADSELVYQLLEEVPEFHALARQTFRNWVNKFQFERILDLTEPLIV
jgi:PAS domain S-box-containing protein